MNVAIMTGIDELNDQIQSKIKDSLISIYPKYLLENTADIVIISPLIDMSTLNISFQDFLYELRKREIRIILLLGDKDSEYLGYALALGIYDIIFDPFNEEKIIKKLKYPTMFSEIAKLYLNVGGQIKFKSDSNSINSEDINLKKQIINLFTLLGLNIQNTNQLSNRELLSILEKFIIEKIL
ncbi:MULTISPECIES: hypothetical protein [Clostridium]|uniref:Response regulator n=1 Tax=Clostridium sporogenes TaxID=1509 RepID=A0A1L3NB33_CLOSG|nr:MULTISPECIES: hypothetical protein [Clostridium]AJE13233.1 response regulator [Clostridium botulinum CDC_1436]APH13330.1 response regulator [Clostridium sporogenes]